MEYQSTYYHEVQYYETDAMRIVHHSNYIRWFEEARTAFLKQEGLDYDKLEDRGIMFPVLSVDCQYKVAVTFGQTVKIVTRMEFFSGIRFGLSYAIYSQDGSVLHATGKTTHCFLNTDLKPINVKKYALDVYEHFLLLTEQEQ